MYSLISIFLTDNLIALAEVLGGQSIRAVELKQLIGLLRPLESGLLPTYYYRLQQALTVMSHRLGKDGPTPLHYFDLRTPGTVSIWIITVQSTCNILSSILLSSLFIFTLHKKPSY